MAPATAGVGRFTAALRTRAALGLRPAMTPVMVFVPLGILFGPWGTATLTPIVVASLDVVVSVALATIGVFVGIAVGTQQRHARRLIAASTTEGVVTFLFVTGATFVLLASWRMPLPLGVGLSAAALGLAAAASAAPFASETADSARRIAARVADLDDVLPIVLGGSVLSLAAPDRSGILYDLLITGAVGVGVGVSGWLLFDRAEGAERGVFVIGTLALLGGGAAYAGTSPLIAGMVAGVIWARTPGHTDRIAATDLRKAEHPLVVLLLIVAGAGLEPTVAGVWLLVPFVLFRTTGKLLGGWMASRVAPGVAPADLGAYLLPPGVLGIGFVLNLQQVAPTAASPLVFAVAVGAIISELIAVIVTPAPSTV
jgi:hypothetical protein